MNRETLIPEIKAYADAVAHYLEGHDDPGGKEARGVRDARAYLEASLKEAIEPVVVLYEGMAYGVGRDGKLLTFHKVIDASPGEIKG